MDPYLQTVTTLDPYKLDPRVAEGSAPYFASGDRYVADLFQAIERVTGPGFVPGAAVDFGCSVGRVAIPLARRCRTVIGLDVSQEALAEAGRNAERFGASNTRWLPSDDDLTSMPDGVDLFHSYNVLQHLAVARGMEIIGRALGKLARGGVLAIHVPTADLASRLRRAINWAQARVPGVNRLANLARGRAADYPQMLMNAYDLRAVLSLLAGRGCDGAYCKLVDQGRYPGAIVIARVP
jgi:SAM-dependent methyltransferase